MYCNMMSRLTKVVKHRVNKNNFFKLIILFKNKVSTINIKIGNLNKRKALKIGLSSSQVPSYLWNNPGL